VTERIHLVVDREEKERFRRLASREGRSLSDWLREAARARAASTAESGLEDPESLRAFLKPPGRARPPRPSRGWRIRNRSVRSSRRAIVVNRAGSRTGRRTGR